MCALLDDLRELEPPAGRQDSYVGGGGRPPAVGRRATHGMSKKPKGRKRFAEATTSTTADGGASLPAVSEDDKAISKAKMDQNPVQSVCVGTEGDE